MDTKKTKEELIAELVLLRQHVKVLEQAATVNHKQNEVTPGDDSLELNSPDIASADKCHHRVEWNNPGEQNTWLKQETAGQVISATAKRDSLEDTQQTKYRHAEILQRATVAITETLSLDERLDRILEQLQQVVTCQSASVQLLYDGYLEIVGGRGWSDPEAIIGGQFSIPGDNPNTEVILTRQPVLLEDSSSAYSIFEKAQFSHIRSWLGIPLIVRDEVIGLLALDNVELSKFGYDQLRVAVAFARQVAIAIENARLFEKAQQQSRRLNQTLAVSELLHRGLELEQVLEQIVEGILKLGFNNAVLNVYEPEEERLTVRAIAGLSEADREALSGVTYRWSDFQALMQERFRISRSYLVQHDEFDWDKEFSGITITPNIEYRGPGYWHPDDALMVPLWTTQRGPLGVLSVDSPIDGRFPDPDTIRTLENFANQAAIALENARLHRQVQQDAETKAILLREINHRVQNNLAAIIGLVSIEQSRVGSADQATCQAILQDLFNRIQGLSTVHRMLSDTEWSPLPLSELTSTIINSTLKTLPLDRHITVDVPPSLVQVGSRYANSLALIINELVTNVIKYALAERLIGHITVRIEDEGDQILFEFRDDGPGFPDEIVRQERQNMGIHLIRTLVQRDLDGELSLHNHNGAVTTIRFKPDRSLKLADRNGKG